MIAPLLFVTALFVSCMPRSLLAGPQQAIDKKTGAPAGDQPKTQPTINITVAAPVKTADERNAEAKTTAEQIAIQNKIATYTKALVVVGFLDVLAIALGLGYTARAANAARNSANAAMDSTKLARSSAAIALAQKRINDKQLKLLQEDLEIARKNADAVRATNRQWVNVRKYRFTIEAIGPSFSFEMKNSTSLPITLTRIVVLSSVGGDAFNIMGLDYFLTPQDIYAIDFDLDKADSAGLFKNGDRVVFDIIGSVYFTDSLGDHQRQLFGRHIVRQSSGKIYVRSHAGGLRKRWLGLLGQHPDIQTEDQQPEEKKA